jgi:putative transposase
MQIAHKIELKSNNTQKTYFKKACGISRFTWNWALGKWNEQYASGLKPSGMGLKKQFNAIKEAEYSWTYEVTKYASQQPFLDLQEAFNRFFKKLGGRPKFKKKGKSHDSFYIGGDQIKLDETKRRIKIPNLGWVRMREELRFSGKINSVVVSRTADRWFASIQVDTPIQFPKHENQVSVGIDLGIHKLATLSHGIAFEAPKPLKKLLWRLKRQSRKLSRKTLGSNNSKKQIEKLARLHMRIGNIRKDTLHKVTSFLAFTYAQIGIEDLNVKGMVRNRKLARSISDVGFGEFRRQIEYKTEWRNGKIVVHGRFFPSSKKCSNCDLIKESLSLSERVFKCECSLEIDRDLNASINLDPVPKVLREFTPVEMKALRKSVHPVSVTSINESGNKLQLLCG